MNIALRSVPCGLCHVLLGLAEKGTVIGEKGKCHDSCARLYTLRGTDDRLVRNVARYGYKPELDDTEGR